jgi:hypothetical protein
MSTMHKGRSVYITIETRCSAGHEKVMAPDEFHAPGPRWCTCGNVRRAIKIVRTPVPRYDPLRLTGDFR